MSGEALEWAVLLLLVLAVVAVIMWWRHRPRATQYSNNITDAYWWLWEQLQLLAPGSQLGGIYANKAGYHNARDNLPAWDYSVTDNPPDWGGPGWAAAAIDWTFPEAQSGDYSRISVFTRRLIDSGKDPADPRMNGWREVYGNADTDTYVEGYDFRYQCDVTSDSSHLWHIHLSENRDQTESIDNKAALLSVLSGQPLDEWLLHGALMGDGTVILTCPTDPARLDLFYVGPAGEVWHRWYTSGGMDAMWTGRGAGENLGGRITVGTLSASWAPDGSVINIVGLGTVDEPPAPEGCGQYWGFELGRNGVRSGWGSLTNVYGARP